MIRYICDNKTDEFMATAAGNMADVLAELCLLLATSYNLIRAQDPQAAEVFREGGGPPVQTGQPRVGQGGRPGPCGRVQARPRLAGGGAR